MLLVTLAVWLIAALVGLALVRIWLSHGGLASTVTRRFSKTLPLTHAAAAVISLVLFLVYWFGDIPALRPIVLLGLVGTAALGLAMFVPWLSRLGARTSSSVGAAVTPAPEDHFPMTLVVLHGIAAVATLIVYIVAAYLVAR